MSGLIIFFILVAVVGLLINFAISSDIGRDFKSPIKRAAIVLCSLVPYLMFLGVIIHAIARLMIQLWKWVFEHKKVEKKPEAEFHGAFATYDPGAFATYDPDAFATYDPDAYNGPATGTIRKDLDK